MRIADRILILTLTIILSADGSLDTNFTDINPNSNTAAVDLLAHLTNPKLYDRYTSPSHGLFKHQPDIINLRLHVYYIKHQPAKQLQFQAQLLIQLRWKDERLSYSDKDLNIEKISGEKDFLHHIWSPYIYLANERAALIRGKQNKDVTVNILPDGTVLYDSRLITSVVCGVKLGRFPLDQQKCYFNIDTWKFTSSDLLLKWENDTAVSISKETPFLAEYQLVSAVHLTDYKYTEPDSIHDHVFNCSSLRVMFVVSRKYGFYLMNYYLPSALIVAISWVTFWESPDATPGRCILGATTMLTFILLGVETSKSLPSKTYIRSNDVWFIGCTAFIFCALAEFAFANTIWRYGGQAELKKRTSKYILKSSIAPPKEALKPRRRSLSCPSSPTTRWENPLKRVVNNELTVKSLSDLEISLPLSELKTMRKEMLEISEKPAPPPTTMSWQDIAVWMDKKSRFVFPLSFLVFNIIYWGFLCIA
ncbi:pH-sensitive chloride channel 2-like [Planococcus citri]|uniref:pH-sensitive chloride channel 2-like n=1 Tax=Planococcus citri TaxID=170843 RepID=UPI0031F8E06D